VQILSWVFTSASCRTGREICSNACGLLPETLILFFLNQINSRERDLNPNFATPFLPSSVSGTEKNVSLNHHFWRKKKRVFFLPTSKD
jgi:hypothetical protein